MPSLPQCPIRDHVSWLIREVRKDYHFPKHEEYSNVDSAENDGEEVEEDEREERGQFAEIGTAVYWDNQRQSKDAYFNEHIIMTAFEPCSDIANWSKHICTEVSESVK